MGVREKSVQIFSGLKGLIYLFVAICSFLAVYPIYSTIITMSMSNMAKFTIILIFWLLAFTVIYMGVIWTIRGKVGYEDVPIIHDFNKK